MGPMTLPAAQTALVLLLALGGRSWLGGDVGVPVAVGQRQVTLSEGGVPAAMPVLERSVLGNLRDQSQPVMTQDRGAMQIQISRKHAQIAQIYLGNPPQRLNCLVDSGSSDLWMPSMRCRHCENKNNFNADVSKTFKPELYNGRPRSVKISYGSGEVIGYAVHDSLHFGSMHLDDQAFIIVEDSALPRGRMWDGICGLGWKGLAQVSPTLYENIQRHGHRALFSIVPSMGPSARGISQAHMVVGEVPHGSMKPGSLVWVQAERFDPSGVHLGNKLTFWMVSGSLQINAPQPIPARFLVDTGTNQVLLVPQNHYHLFIRSLIPPQAFEQLCGNDPRAGVICDCRIQQMPGLKPLQIYFSGRPFALPVSEMFVKARSTDGGELCLLTIQPDMMTGGASTDDLIGNLLGSLFGPRRRLREGVAADANAAGGRRLQTRLEGLLGHLGSLLGARRGAGMGGFPPFGATGPVSSPNEHWMIGGVFLEHFVTIFDFDNARMGFAEPRLTARRRLTTNLTANLTREWAARELPPLSMEPPARGLPWVPLVAGLALAGGAGAAGICLLGLGRRLLGGLSRRGREGVEPVPADIELVPRGAWE